MDKLNFVQIGGFPLKAERLQEMQAAYGLLNVLGELAGDKSIIKGCVQTGTTVSDGAIYLNGEVYKFIGGNVQATVRVLVNSKVRAFQNGEQKEVFMERYVTFASGTGAIPWADFKRAESILSLQGRILPPGTNPQIYTGSVANIPTGWQLCDGTNGTPQMQNAFIVGYDPNDPDYNEIGKTGGAKNVSLTEAQMPSHTHTGNTTSAGTHTHSVPAESPIAGSSVHFTIQTGSRGRQQGTSAGAHTHSLNINSAGSGDAHENRPPYYTVAYIIYTGN